MERAEESVGVAEGIEETEALVQCWAEVELFFGAAVDLCGGGSERLENHTIRTESS